MILLDEFSLGRPNENLLSDENRFVYHSLDRQQEIGQTGLDL